MNLEEKENTAEVAPEAAAQATIQAVQENNAQDAGVQETAGAVAPQEQPVKKSQNRRPSNPVVMPFELRFVELTENRERMQMGPYVIDAYRVNHNVLCYGYSITIPRTGRFDVERARSEEIPQKFWSRLQKGEEIEHEGRLLTPDMVLGPDRRGLKVTYCTDTRPVPVIAEYAAGADLFICEGMYGEKEKAAKAREYKHMTFYEAAALAKQANPKQMWLTHYSPSLTKPEEYMEEVRSIFPRAKAARDGWTAELEFDED